MSGIETPGLSVMSPGESMRAPGAMAGFGDMLDERLLRERIVWLEGEVRDENSNRIAKQLQVLAAEDPDKDITLYINSPGGPSPRAWSSTTRCS